MSLKTIDVTASLIIVLGQDLLQLERLYWQAICPCRSKFSLLSAILDQLYDLGLAIVSVVAPKLAHSIGARLAPAHRSGTETI